ncbi:MAG: YihA family ribosome biogenesis GTP-binding protein [Clostridiales bacterium GWE2_32_10]|nr:MAG: YihA family ribosome biogenesis GTP-binding protein [Clostridiales bacterium GWE2_32_10]HBY21620.1 YihA family ribosome biogenesis GTP-binding protein [Clostridiales bacterium]
MNLNNINLEMTAGRIDQFPIDEIPEIAFVGRSNVGKSSLLNTMMNRKSLARTSSAPGKTRTVNFYNIDETIRLVDLPGYGYASVSKKQQGSWLKIVDEYLTERENLKCIALLLDIRHEPNTADKLMFEFIREMDIPHIIVITKADKLGKNAQIKNVGLIRKILGMDKDDNVVLFSSLNKTGKDDLWEMMTEILGVE